MFAAILLLISAILSNIYADVLILGPKCPTHQDLKLETIPFNKLSNGKWFEFASTLRWHGFEYKCTEFDITIVDDKNVTLAYRSATPSLNLAWKETLHIIKGQENMWSAMPVNETNTIKIVGSDLKNYAVIWSCSPFLQKYHWENLIVLTKERMPSNATLSEIVKLVEKLNSDQLVTTLIPTSHENCHEESDAMLLDAPEEDATAWDIAKETICFDYQRLYKPYLLVG